MTAPLSWRDIPVRAVAPPPHHCRCWNCGRPGVSWCAIQCRPTPKRGIEPSPTPINPIAYVPPTEAEEAADARVAAVLDGRAA